MLRRHNFIIIIKILIERIIRERIKIDLRFKL